jgi:hypothetical protein
MDTVTVANQPPRPSGVGMGCLVGPLLGVMAGLVVLYGSVSASRVPLTSACALALVLGNVALARRMVLPITAALPAAILIVAGAVMEEGRPLVSREGQGAGDVLVFLVYRLPGAFVLGAGAGFVTGLLLAAPSLGGERVGQPSRGWTSRASIIAGAAVLLVALPIWTRRPSPERYVATRPVLGELAALPLSYGAPQCEDVRDVAGQSATFGSVHVRRNNRCGCGLSLAYGVPAPDPSLSFMTWYKMDMGPPPYAPCERLTVRIDDAHRLVLVEDDGAYGPRAFRYAPETPGILGPSVDVTTADVGSGTGPSSWHVLPALVGLAIAVGAARDKARSGARLAITAALLPALPLAVALLARLLR